MFANRFAANNRIANRLVAALTTKTSDVSPLQSKIDHFSYYCAGRSCVKISQGEWSVWCICWWFWTQICKVNIYWSTKQCSVNATTPASTGGYWLNVRPHSFWDFSGKGIAGISIPDSTYSNSNGTEIIPFQNKSPKFIQIYHHYSSYSCSSIFSTLWGGIDGILFQLYLFPKKCCIPFTIPLFHLFLFQKIIKRNTVLVYLGPAKYTALTKLLARQSFLGITHDGSRTKAETYSSISATNWHQLRQKMYQ